MKTKREKQRELEQYQVEETFHRHEWVVQRIGWAALAVLLTAACAGLLGNGPLAHHTVVTADGALTVDRFARRDSPTIWVIEPAAGHTTASNFTLRISSAVLQHVKIEAITPAAQDQALAANGVQFTFHTLAPNAQVIFHVEPLDIGWIEGEFQFGNSSAVTIRQLVYP